MDDSSYVRNYIILYLIIILCFVLIYSYGLNRTLFRPSKLNNDQIILGDGYRQILLSDKECNLSAIHMDKYHSNTILFLHGRFGNVKNYRNIFKLFNRIQMNIFFLDYSGYGISKGYPSISRIIKDSNLAYKHLRTMVNAENIIIWGESLGSIPAINVSSRPCAGLVIFSGFSSVDDVMCFSDSYKKRMMGAMMKNSIVPRNNLNNYKILRKTKCPVLVIHSKHDSQIPIGCAGKLYKNINHDNKQFINISGDHHTPTLEQHHLDSILRFVDSDSTAKIHEIQHLLRISNDQSVMILSD